MKLHVSMNVEDFEASVKFYSGMFKQEPTVLKDDYAKWDVESPSVNFVIEPCIKKPAGLDHLGIQVEKDEDLEELASRIKDSGQPFTAVENANCCYANSDKAWVQGMAGEKWEAFLTHTHDGAAYGEDTVGDLVEDDSCCGVQVSCCEPKAAATETV